MPLLGLTFGAFLRAQNPPAADSWQLFLDVDAVVASRQGVHPVLHSPKRFAGNPILRGGNGRETRGVTGVNVLYDPASGWLYMYYQASSLPGKDGKVANYFGRAQSRDGIHWERPALGLVDLPEVGKQNNYLNHRSGWVDIDPHPASPDRRFVMIYEDDLPGGKRSKYSAVSPDGLHWTKVVQLGDLRKTSQRTTPTSSARYIYVCQNWVDDPTLRRYRGVWRTESNDLEHWTGARWALPRHAASYDPNLEDYGMSARLVAENQYHGYSLGYAWTFHTDPNGRKLSNGVRAAGTTDVVLVVSRDTIHWDRVGWPQAFLPLGGPGTWDRGMVYLSASVEVEDRLLFYYTGYHITHDEVPEGRPAIGVATLRRGGFVSMEPDGDEGTLTTKPFLVSGPKLVVNAQASGGPITVEVLDEGGKAVPGFRSSVCNPLSQDDLQQTVSWKQKKNLSSLAGKTVALRFVLQRGAKLYAFQVIP